MHFSLKRVAAVLIAVSTVGCATIMHGGRTQRIGISSIPTGATVSVDGNKSLGNTPLFADLKRGEEHIVTIEMPGYEKSQLTLIKSMSGWVWGNIIFGGLIGLAIDVVSGSMYNLSPEQLNAELKKSSTTVSHNESNGIIVVAVLRPDPAWQKIGSLAPAK
ncbi:MAG: PEGA domain-containing protein [Gallionellaceae bacterium]|nr:MAG: PEGA domain-containing protein [Gallionellaceae bacterium]